MIKTLIYLADDQPVAMLIRGDHEANEGKIRRALAAGKLELAPPDAIEKVTGAPVGFAGPVGLSIAVWADDDVARHAQRHHRRQRGRQALRRREPRARDFQIADASFADLRNAGAGDPCPRCGDQAGTEAGDRGRPRLQARHEILRRPWRPNSSTPTSSSTP